jgi:16S rRNA (cytosine967-C5)-methyltransferase
MNYDKRDSIRAERMIEIAGMVEKAVSRGRPADRELARIFRQNRSFGSHDRRIYSEAAFSLLRWRGWTGTLEQAGPRALLQAALLDADEIAPHLAALADSQHIAPDTLRALGALDLVEKAQALSGMNGGSVPPATESLIPAWALDSLPFDSDARSAWIASIQTALPVWLRIDSGHEPSARSVLETNAISIQPHPALPLAWSSDRNISRAVLNSDEAGHIHLQDLSSQAVALICAPHSGESWWDLCAGGGGKSLHLADLLGGAGSVLASDPRGESLRSLHERARRANIGIIKTRKSGKPAADASYDGVLVDAPCSGSGTWARNPDARWRTDQAFVDNRARLQVRLLEQAAASVKAGGKLVYAVCSLFKQETTDVFAAFSASHPDFKPDPFRNPLAGADCPGQLLIDGVSEQTIAMFVARFRRSAR